VETQTSSGIPDVIYAEYSSTLALRLWLPITTHDLLITTGHTPHTQRRSTSTTRWSPKQMCLQRPSAALGMWFRTAGWQECGENSALTSHCRLTTRWSRRRAYHRANDLRNEARRGSTRTLARRMIVFERAPRIAEGMRETRATLAVALVVVRRRRQSTCPPKRIRPGFEAAAAYTGASANTSRCASGDPRRGGARSRMRSASLLRYNLRKRTGGKRRGIRHSARRPSRRAGSPPIGSRRRRLGRQARRLRRSRSGGLGMHCRPDDCRSGDAPTRVPNHTG